MAVELNIHKNSVFKRAHTAFLFVFFCLKDSMGTPFPHFMLHVCLWISLLALSLRFGNLIFHFSFLQSLPALSFHPSVSLWLNLSVFLYSPFLLWCCSEWSLWNGNEDSGALSLSQSPPLSRHQNEAMPPMFFSDLGVLPNLISGAEREVEEESEQDAEEGEKRRRKRWKERGWKMNEGERQHEGWGQSMGLIQEHLGFLSYYSRAQHNPSSFCWATTPSFWLRISW